MANFQEFKARSPLGGTKHGSIESVVLSEKPLIRSFDLRVAPKTSTFSIVNELLEFNLPLEVGKTNSGFSKSQDPIHVLCLGPDWWLIIGEIDAIQLLEPLRAETHLSIVDVSAGRTQIEIQGPNARKLLEHVWEHDLRENRFAVGACSQGVMGKAPAVLWHRSAQQYVVCVRSSFSMHLWKVLVDASVEF